ncbi:MAG: hypothetical protein Q8N67_01385 [Candidatus Omnitrophota bacterium]|nr:hypothetical protein [Candidatus Omnitrophota bacterium]
MKIKIVLLLAVILFFQSPVYAEAATIKQKVVGKTIKIVARIAVATTNIEKTKKRLVNKLRLMEDKQFRAQYAEFYELVKDIPRDIKIAYNVTPAMTREQMIENIESLDKKNIYKIISSIPDKTVAELFKEYRREYHGRPNNKIQ